MKVLDGVENPGAALFDEIEATIRKYLFLPHEHQYTAMVLWAAATHTLANHEHATRLVFVSPEKQCGKTRALDLLEQLVWRPLATMNATVAAITRSLGGETPPTLLIDEADTIFGTKKSAESNEDLRGILNSGHARGKNVLRVNMHAKKGPKVEELSTFAMVALASIQSLPDTITDRSVEIQMRRRPKSVSVLPYRQRRDGGGVLRPLGKRLGDWADLQEFGAEEVVLPVEDRAADNWESLVAVAEAAGGDWPDRARAAALWFAGAGKTPEASFGNEALADTRRVWPKDRPVAIHSEQIVFLLNQLEQAPWSAYGGKGLNQHHLARLLKPYGVETTQVKIDGANRKGYRKKDLESACASYLDDEAEVSVLVVPDFI